MPRIRLKQLASSGASSGQVIAWASAANQWVPTTIGGGGGYATGTRQVVQSSISSSFTTATSIPLDNTIPQSNEGAEFLTCSITPQSATSTLYVSAVVNVSSSSGSAPTIVLACFRDAGSSAIGAVCATCFATNGMITISLDVKIASSSTSPSTFRLRIGGTAGTTYVNGNSSTSQLFGGVSATTLTVAEVGA